MRNQGYLQVKERLVKAAAAQKKPIIGHFELTPRCNLDCKMCYVHIKDNAKALNRELSTEQWIHIFDDAFNHEMLYATLSGGECLLRKDFKELYLHLWNKRVFVTVLTNGTLINEDYIEFFKKYPPDMIQVSLYGSCENAYLRVTSNRGFEKAIRAIQLLEEANIDVRVTSTPSKYMGDDYINIIRLCKDKGFTIINNDIALIPNREDPDKDDFCLSSEEIIDLSKERALLYGDLTPIDDTPEPFGKQDNTVRAGLTCTAGNCLAAVTWDGIMYPCFNVLIGGSSLLEMSFAEAWKNTVKTSSEILLAKECDGCKYDKVCPKCPAFRLQDFKSGHCNLKMCQITKELVSLGVKKL